MRAVGKRNQWNYLRHRTWGFKWNNTFITVLATCYAIIGWAQVNHSINRHCAMRTCNKKSKIRTNSDRTRWPSDCLFLFLILYFLGSLLSLNSVVSQNGTSISGEATEGISNSGFRWKRDNLQGIYYQVDVGRRRTVHSGKQMQICWN